MTTLRISTVGRLAFFALAVAFAIFVGTRPAPQASFAWAFGIVLGAMAIMAPSLLSRARGFSAAARTVFVGFFVLCAIALAIAELAATGWIGPSSTARAAGIVVGAMAIITGNFLPKAHAFEAELWAGPQTRAAERAIGWILVLVGGVFVLLFVVAPLARAKSIAAAAGIGALVLIGATSVQLVVAVLRRRTRAVTGVAVEQSPRAECNRTRPMVSVLVAFFCVFATACAQYLFGADAHGHAIASWVTTISSSVVALVYMMVTWRRRGGARLH